MKTPCPKELLPSVALAALLLLTGVVHAHAEVTDFPPQGRQPYEKGSDRGTASGPAAPPPAGAPATVRRKSAGDGTDAPGESGEDGIRVLGDRYWRAAHEYCRRHGGRIMDGGNLCMM